MTRPDADHYIVPLNREHALCTAMLTLGQYLFFFFQGERNMNIRRQNRMKEWRRSTALVPTVVLMLAAPALAGQDDFTAAASTEWDNDGNWTLGSVPSSSDDVRLLLDLTPQAYAYISNGEAFANTLRNETTLTVRGAGILTVGGGAGSIAMEAKGPYYPVGNLVIGGGSSTAPGVVNAANINFATSSGFSAPGAVTFSHNSADGSYVFAPNVTGAGQVVVDRGWTVLTGTNAYTEGTNVSFTGRLQGDSDALQGNIELAYFNQTYQGRLIFTGGGASQVRANVSGGGTTIFQNGTVSLANGTSINSGSVILDSATVEIGANSSLLFGGNVGFEGTQSRIRLVNGASQWFRDFSGAGENSAVIEVDATSSLSVGDNIASGSGDFTGTITGAGTTRKTGAGTFALSGESTFTGTVHVNQGRLNILVQGGFTNTDLEVAANLFVDDGAFASVFGRVGSVDNEGTLGAGGDGTAGTLTVTNDVILHPTSILEYDLGTPDCTGAGCVDSDLINVGGNLTLDGVLDVNDAGGFGNGLYRLFDYAGLLIDNGLDIGVAPTGFDSTNLSVQTSVAGQVNLLVGGGGTPAPLIFDLEFTDVGTWTPDLVDPDTQVIIQGSGFDIIDGAQRFDAAVARFIQDSGFDIAIDGQIERGSGGIQFADDGFSLTGGLINLIDDTTIRVGDGTSAGASTTATISTNITGAGGLQKTDLGTLILTGANTYTGGTTVSTGTLQGDTDSLQGAIEILEDALLVFDQASDGILLGDFQGNGSIIKRGAGSLELDVDGNWSTDLNLEIGEGRVLVTAQETGGATFDDVMIRNNAALELGADSQFTTRSLFADGGDVILSTGSYWRVEGAEEGTNLGSVTIGISATVEFLSEDEARIAAISMTVEEGSIWTLGGNAQFSTQGISGSGQATVSGGTLTLAGDSPDFTGSAEVNNGGRLIIDGTVGNSSSPEDLFVRALFASGGSLSGIGNWRGHALAESGGTVAPGNSIGTLNVGSVTFNSGSIFEVELKEGGNTAGVHNDLLNVAGVTTINGGTVHVTPENGTDTGSTYTPNTTYTVLTAGGGVTGTFDTLTDDYAFLNFALSYDANNVFLTSSLADLCLSSFTANQCATANALETVGSGTLFAAITNLSNAEAPRAFNQLSGEIHASSKTALLEDSRFAREATLNRLRVALGGAGSNADQATQETPEGTTLWVQGFGAWSRWNSDGNAARLDRNIGGIFMGGDTQVTNDVTLGLMAGYSRSSLSIGDRSSSGTIDSYTLGAYAGGQWDAVSLKGGLSHTWHSLDTSRAVAFTGFSDSLSASYNARTLQAYTEAAYTIETGNARFEPFANFAYVNLDTDGFTEAGGAAALTANGQSSNASFTTLGIRSETAVALGETMAMLSGGLGWRHAFGAMPTSMHSFAAGGSAFTLKGVPLARDTLGLDAGINVNITENTTFSLSYNGQLGSGLADHSARAGFNIRF